MKELAKQAISSVGMEQKQVKDYARKVRRMHWSTVTKWLQSWRQKFWCRSEYRIYLYLAERLTTTDRVDSIKRDCLEDLLSFQPVESRQEFLSLALERLEAGQHVYTRSAHDDLQQYAWLWERPEKWWLPEVEQEYVFPPESVLLYDYHFTPGMGNEDLDRASIEQIVQDAVSTYGAQQVYTIVRAEDNRLCQILDRVGFIHLHSVFKQRRFGKTRRWMSDRLGSCK